MKHHTATRRVAVWGAAMLSVLLGACGKVSIDSTYVGNADLGAYVKAPSEYRSEVVQTQPEFTMHGFWAP
ncbi:MAG: hypothetical protein EBT17_04435, partial [Actinobacteria bacterium]|nr:hypothetical protein [Actinomycetota bacterium]